MKWLLTDILLLSVLLFTTSSLGNEASRDETQWTVRFRPLHRDFGKELRSVVNSGAYAILTDAPACPQLPARRTIATDCVVRVRKNCADGAKLSVEAKNVQHSSTWFNDVPLVDRIQPPYVPLLVELESEPRTHGVITFYYGRRGDFLSFQQSNFEKHVANKQYRTEPQRIALARMIEEIKECATTDQERRAAFMRLEGCYLACVNQGSGKLLVEIRKIIITALRSIVDGFENSEYKDQFLREHLDIVENEVRFISEHPEQLTVNRGWQEELQEELVSLRKSVAALEE